MELITSRLNVGSYFSGIIILLANCQYYPNHELARPDHKLAKRAIELLVQLLTLKNDDQVNRIMSVLDDLETIAGKAISHYQGHPETVPLPPTWSQAAYSISSDFFRDAPVSVVKCLYPAALIAC